MSERTSHGQPHRVAPVGANGRSPLWRRNGPAMAGLRIMGRWSRRGSG